MSFGAEWQDGHARFRLWAPAAEQVELSLIKTDASATLPLNAVGEGWFELRTELARPGDRYRFRINGSQVVPDPASRFQPEDVHGPSEIRDPAAFEWTDSAWKGRPWEQAVIYELHVGTFSPNGTFSGVTERLDYLADLGVTALELMPIADFPGGRNWGYDGVHLYAPHHAYCGPEGLKRLVSAAHTLGLGGGLEFRHEPGIALQRGTDPASRRSDQGGTLLQPGSGIDRPGADRRRARGQPSAPGGRRAHVVEDGWARLG